MEQRIACGRKTCGFGRIHLLYAGSRRIIAEQKENIKKKNLPERIRSGRFLISVKIERRDESVKQSHLENAFGCSLGTVSVVLRSHVCFFFKFSNKVVYIGKTDFITDCVYGIIGIFQRRDCSFQPQVEDILHRRFSCHFLKTLIKCPVLRQADRANLSTLIFVLKFLSR